MKTDRVELLINGESRQQWERYEIDSDLLTPADAWHVSLGMSGGEVPPDALEGAPVVVTVGGETVLTGYIDETSHSVSKSGHMFTMSGRDLAADLLDCSAPIFDKKMVKLGEVVAAIIGEFNIKKHRIDADQTLTRDKVHPEPGQSAWDALVNAAEANGLWPWFEPDGTLVIGGPDYSAAVVASLIMRRNGKGNNVLSLEKTASHAGRFSAVTVYGFAHGTDSEIGKNNLHASYSDTGVLRKRPKIVMDHEADNYAVCRGRAEKLVADSRLNGLTLTATVQGHRIIAPGQISNGMLWKPGQRINVTSEPHGIKDAVFFLMGRKFICDRNNGTRTVLTLKEDKMWITNAHPHRNNHRLGKNALPGKIIELPAHPA